MIVVIMGVAGSGKSTVGKLLAERLSLPFIEADDFHPEKNILKMSQGIPLNDEDRYPWLRSLSHQLQLNQKNKGAVLACSALKEKYRKILQEGLNAAIEWIFLEGTEETIRHRMQNRKGHFMPKELLHSQFALLEKPLYAHTISIDKSPGKIVDEIASLIDNRNG